MGTKSINDVLRKSRISNIVRPQDLTRIEAKALIESLKKQVSGLLQVEF